MPPGGEGELPYTKEKAFASEIMKKPSNRYQDLVLRIWLGIVFTPKRYQILYNNTLSLVICFFRFKALAKRYCKSSCCETFEAEHPKRYQNHFLTTKRYDEYPRLLYAPINVKLLGRRGEEAGGGDGRTLAGDLSSDQISVQMPGNREVILDQECKFPNPISHPKMHG